MKGLLLSLLSLLVCLPVYAAVPKPPDLDARSYVLFDYQSGQVLADHDAHARVEPASITKIMTAYVTFSELREGHIKMDDKVLISEKAWRMPGSRTFVEVGKNVLLSDLIHGMIIQSGNDATVAIAEHIAGDESVFTQLMNQTAAKLGMKDTHYMNATGLPHEDHYTSAYDIALLSQALIRDFPDEYKLFSQKEFTYGQRNKITQHNRNLLLEMDASADGIKTGHTDSAGFCLASSAIRDGRRLISVVMGTKSSKQRARESKTLLDYGFRFFDTVALLGPTQPAGQVEVWKGAEDSVQVGTLKPLYLSVPRDEASKLKVKPNVEGRAIAPLAAGQRVGTVSVTLDDKELSSMPLVTLKPVAEGGMMQQMIDSVRLWING